MTDKLREAAQMALYALQESKPIDINDPSAFYRSAHAIEALRAALAQPEQEPVAWCIVENDRVHGLVKSKPAVMNAEKWQPLYTAPPQRDEAPAKAVEWQGLTDEDFLGLTTQQIFAMKFAEAKLKEKNT